MTSGLMRGRTSSSDFLRFLFDLSLVIEFEFGKEGCGSGGIFLGGDPATSTTAVAGGEHGGIEEGGETDATSKDVMSTDGERRRLPAEE